MTKHLTNLTKKARFLLATLVVAGTMLGQTQSAVAATPQFSPGYVSMASSVCFKLAANVLDPLTRDTRYLRVSVPTVYASDRTSGLGNDSQIVHYWVRLFEVNPLDLTPRNVMLGYTSGVETPDGWTYGGGQWANDNKPAPFPSIGTILGRQHNVRYTVSTPKKVRIQLLIAWYTKDNVYLGHIDPIIANDNGGAGFYLSALAYNGSYDNNGTQPYC